MKTPTIHQSKATALATVVFAALVFTTAPAATGESWPQRIEADWLLAEEVAQVSKPAVSQISKSACVANGRSVGELLRSAGLETGDWFARYRLLCPAGLALASLRQSLSQPPRWLKSADSEVCTTVAFAANWLLAEGVAALDQLGGRSTGHVTENAKACEQNLQTGDPARIRRDAIALGERVKT